MIEGYSYFKSYVHYKISKIYINYTELLPLCKLPAKTNILSVRVWTALWYVRQTGWGKWYMWCGWVVCCEGYTPHIVGWLELWHAPRQAQNWHTDEATLWRQSVTLLPEQRLGQGCLSLCVYGVPQTLTWALPKEKGREKEGERNGDREEGNGESWAKTFPCCAHTHKKHEFVFCSAVDAAGQWRRLT